MMNEIPLIVSMLLHQICYDLILYFDDISHISFFLCETKTIWNFWKEEYWIEKHQSGMRVTSLKSRTERVKFSNYVWQFEFSFNSRKDVADDDECNYFCDKDK